MNLFVEGHCDARARDVAFLTKVLVAGAAETHVTSGITGVVTEFVFAAGAKRRRTASHLRYTKPRRSKKNWKNNATTTSGDGGKYSSNSKSKGGDDAARNQFLLSNTPTMFGTETSKWHRKRMIYTKYNNSKIQIKNSSFNVKFPANSLYGDLKSRSRRQATASTVVSSTILISDKSYLKTIELSGRGLMEMAVLLSVLMDPLEYNECFASFEESSGSPSSAILISREFDDISIFAASNFPNNLLGTVMLTVVPQDCINANDSTGKKAKLSGDKLFLTCDPMIYSQVYAEIDAIIKESDKSVRIASLSLNRFEIIGSECQGFLRKLIKSISIIDACSNVFNNNNSNSNSISNNNSNSISSSSSSSSNVGIDSIEFLRSLNNPNAIKAWDEGQSVSLSICDLKLLKLNSIFSCLFGSIMKAADNAAESTPSSFDAGASINIRDKDLYKFSNSGSSSKGACSNSASSGSKSHDNKITRLSWPVLNLRKSVVWNRNNCNSSSNNSSNNSSNSSNNFISFVPGPQKPSGLVKSDLNLNRQKRVQSGQSSRFVHLSDTSEAALLAAMQRVRRAYYTLSSSNSNPSPSTSISRTGEASKHKIDDGSKKSGNFSSSSSSSSSTSTTDFLLAELKPFLSRKIPLVVVKKKFQNRSSTPVISRSTKQPERFHFITSENCGLDLFKALLGNRSTVAPSRTISGAFVEPSCRIIPVAQLELGTMKREKKVGDKDDDKNMKVEDTTSKRPPNRARNIIDRAVKASPYYNVIRFLDIDIYHLNSWIDGKILDNRRNKTFYSYSNGQYCFADRAINNTNNHNSSNNSVSSNSDESVLRRSFIVPRRSSYMSCFDNDNELASLLSLLRSGTKAGKSGEDDDNIDGYSDLSHRLNRFLSSASKVSPHSSSGTDMPVFEFFPMEHSKEHASCDSPFDSSSENMEDMELTAEVENSALPRPLSSPLLLVTVSISSGAIYGGMRDLSSSRYVGRTITKWRLFTGAELFIAPPAAYDMWLHHYNHCCRRKMANKAKYRLDSCADLKSSGVESGADDSTSGDSPEKLKQKIRSANIIKNFFRHVKGLGLWEGFYIENDPNSIGGDLDSFVVRVATDPYIKRIFSFANSDISNSDSSSNSNSNSNSNGNSANDSKGGISGSDTGLMTIEISNNPIGIATSGIDTEYFYECHNRSNRGVKTSRSARNPNLGGSKGSSNGYLNSAPTTKRIRLGKESGRSDDSIGVIDANRMLDQSREVTNRYLSSVLLSRCLQSNSSSSGSFDSDAESRLYRSASNIVGIDSQGDEEDHFARGVNSMILYRNPGSRFLRPAFVKCMYSDK